ncbi:MAG TPA: phytanoyl-CoA dioxygenase family protein [Planctomycetota bacterium]|nr:phytanoyl-CoA dioxygenase family protein [Planctomycetota bacterium]
MIQPALGKTPSTRTLRFGPADLELGGAHLGEMREANALLDDPQALRARLADDGYLLIRGLHDPGLVLEARRQMAEALAANGQLDADAPIMDLVPRPESQGGFFGGDNDLTTCPAFQELVSRDRVMDFFRHYFQAPVRTFDFKWLRLVGHGGFTGAHLDVVYMGRGTQDLYTCWTPIGDVPFEQGPLAICVGSHRLPGFAKMQETYGNMDVDRDHVVGWFTSDPLEVVERFGGRWVTSEFKAGDALVFGMRTLHASLTNVSGRLRLSSDTRYQRAADPVDERWIGEKPIAHYGWADPAKNVDMAEMRRRWGV